MPINIPVFTETDIYVLENTDRKLLKKSIEFLKTYTEVMWKDNDTGEIVPHSELKKSKHRHQPLPVYAPEYKRMGEMFFRMIWFPKGVGSLRAEGFYENGSLASRLAGTLYSPATIATVICHDYVYERISDGLFGRGAENGLYLKMLLHLDDLIEYYEYSKNPHPEEDGESPVDESLEPEVDKTEDEEPEQPPEPETKDDEDADDQGHTYDIFRDKVKNDVF